VLPDRTTSSTSARPTNGRRNSSWKLRESVVSAPTRNALQPVKGSPLHGADELIASFKHRIGVVEGDTASLCQHQSLAEPIEERMAQLLLQLAACPAGAGMNRPRSRP